MRKQTDCPALREPNMRFVSVVARKLRKEKAISKLNFEDLFVDITNVGVYGGISPANLDNPLKFLIYHGMLTIEKINGLILYVSTQKTLHTKRKNLFPGYIEP
jgi:hypothetical protein